MKLIVGLGNPGTAYENTRHNAGFMVVNAIHDKFGFGRERRFLNALVSRGRLAGTDCLLVRPQTYMNNSGEAVGPLTRFYKIKPEDVILIYDDIDLDFGKLRIRSNGSAGGHNGMKSVIAHLRTDLFPRIRVGVGAKPEGWDLADYVLSHLTASEQAELAATVETAAEAAEEIVKNGVVSAQNKFSNK